MFRKAFLPVVLVVVGVAVVLLSPWAVQANQPWSIFMASMQKLTAEREREQDLDHQLELARWRLFSGHKVVLELAKGHLALMEAASWFHHNHDHAADVILPYYTKGMGSLEEQICRQVIRRVDGVLSSRNDPNRLKVVHHLEDELHDLLAHPKSMVFSESPEVPGLSPAPEHD